MSAKLPIATVVASLAFAALPARAAEPDATRIHALEAQLAAAQSRVSELESTLAGLASDVAELKRSAQVAEIARAAPSAAAADSALESTDDILVPDLGHDERGAELTGRPELFVQTGYAANPIDGAAAEDATTRFTLNRLEARWSGRVAERLGMGFEIQYHPAPDGASEELVNDAFIEYYASEDVTLRVGQFVKPFGFDLQHSSSDRESPERAMFAGYFFPGQRDRGALIAADLSRRSAWLEGVTVYGGLLNGNRFFDDDNDELNANLRIRKVFASRSFAIGASWQRGSQLLAPGVSGSDRFDVAGVDAQWVFGRLGIRAEYVHGDMPSTLLSLEPEFAAGFAPGEETWGGAAFFDYRLTADDAVYWRWDRLDNDPVTRADVRAFNAGYLRRLGENSRVGFDYQWKDDVTFNDDELNTRFSLRWNLTF